MGSLASVADVLKPLHYADHHVPIRPWAHPLLQECRIHCLSFSPWSRYRLLLRTGEQQHEVDGVVRHGEGHGSPPLLLLLLVHHPLPPHWIHWPLWLLVHIQDGEVQ